MDMAMLTRNIDGMTPIEQTGPLPLTDAELDEIAGGETSLVDVVGAVIKLVFGGGGGAGGAGGSGGTGGSCSCTCGPTIQINL
jgi:hypothetical protein